MIRKIAQSEFGSLLNVVNDAASAYKGVIPTECWKEPYMSSGELNEEIGHGVSFYGWFENETLVAVMGIQAVKDVTLIRHAYVLNSCQQRGLGQRLLLFLINRADTSEILVGTWKAAWWAAKFYEKNGFQLVPRKSLSKLRQYWTISDKQAKTSVVLRFGKRRRLRLYEDAKAF